MLKSAFGRLSQFLKDGTAVTGLEYALLAGLIVVGIITGAGLLGSRAGASYTNTSAKYEAAMNGSSAAGMPGEAPANAPAASLGGGNAVIAATSHTSTP